MKNIAILGSTGSIGKSSLKVVKHHPDLFNIEVLTTNSNIEELKNQINIFKPKKVVICNKIKYTEFKKDVNCANIKVLYGSEGLIEVVRDDNINFIINSLVGFTGLIPTIEAIKNNKDIAIANKEAIVVGGDIILPLAKKHNVNIIPIDSEHSALLFLLRYSKRSEVKKLILTASGGPFIDKNKEDLKNATLNEALNHPTWKMGRKITIDSSTLMNKGFEVIEAHHLFGFDFKDIDVIIHRESVIHSMIETIDGEIYAQLGPSDMKFPIQNAMTYPKVYPNDYDKLKLWEIKNLSFDMPDLNKFPLLKLAYEVGKEGGTMPTILNAANEVAVWAFLEGRIKYSDIVFLINKGVEEHNNIRYPNLDDIIDSNNKGRESTYNQIKKLT